MKHLGFEEFFASCWNTSSPLICSSWTHSGVVMVVSTLHMFTVNNLNPTVCCNPEDIVPARRHLCLAQERFYGAALQQRLSLNLQCNYSRPEYLFLKILIHFPAPNLEWAFMAQSLKKKKKRKSAYSWISHFDAFVQQSKVRVEILRPAPNLCPNVSSAVLKHMTTLPGSLPLLSLIRVKCLQTPRM